MRCFGRRCDGRMRSLRVRAEAHLVWARKGPTDEGPAGPFRGEYYSVGSSGLGAGKGSGSKSSQPMGMVNTWSSATVICSVSILLTIAIPLISKLYSLGLDFTEKTVF